MNINKSLLRALTYRSISITPNPITMLALATNITVRSKPKIIGQLIPAQNWTPFSGTVNKFKIGE